jgi:type III pantothenate kinase
MLLLIDAGNTRVKWALADPDADIGSWYANGALLHEELSGLEEILRQHEVRRVWISNVAGDAMATQLAELLQASGLRDAPLHWFRAQARQAGVVNGYRDPEQLGCDRFASLLGARGLFPEQSLIIVTAGTATTIDALHASGQFLGGMILPGLGTMAQSLALSTAQLPRVETRDTRLDFADNTLDAIVSGCLHAQVGAITQARAKLPDAHCLLSGGAASYLLPYLSAPIEQVDQLVLRGLHIAALSESSES